jgi:hypothetical protein
MVEARQENIEAAQRTAAAIQAEGNWEPHMGEQATWEAEVRASRRTAFDAGDRNILHMRPSDAEPDLTSERKLLRKMYEDTQKDLASIPGDYVTVYRGIRADALGHDPARQRAAQGKSVRIHRIDAPVTSWSLDPATAHGFNTAMLVARIPKSRILSTWRTGLGVATEAEVLVLGGNPADQALVLL